MTTNGLQEFQVESFDDENLHLSPKKKTGCTSCHLSPLQAKVIQANTPPINEAHFN